MDSEAQEDRIPISPLSGKEYDMLRHVIVAVDQLAKAPNALKKRLKTIPNGWRNFRCLEYWLGKVADDLLATVPTEKLLSFRTELQNSKLCLYTKWAPIPTDGVCQVPEKAFIQLLNTLIQNECWSCEKKNADVRHCAIRKTYLDCLHYEPAPEDMPKDGSCIMAGWDHVQMEE